jgi:hypothetical protein
MEMDKLEMVIAIGIVAILVFGFMFVSLNLSDGPNLRSNTYSRSIDSDNIVGTYKASKDSKSFMELREDGTYVLNINNCEGYLELSGIYEIRDNTLVLINRNSFPDYETLVNNEELFFTGLEGDFVLEEDLVCVYKGTNFVRQK